MVKRIFRYLKGTYNYGILNNPYENKGIEAFAGADYAGDVVSRKSTSGMVFKFCGGAISWGSRKQKSIKVTPTEAELISASEASKDLIWLTRLMKAIDFKMEIPVLQIDNQNVVRLIKNLEFHNKSKHIDVRYKFIREKVYNNLMMVDYVSREKQLGDLFTKVLPKIRFINLCEELGMVKLDLGEVLD